MLVQTAHQVYSISYSADPFRVYAALCVNSFLHELVGSRPSCPVTQVPTRLVWRTSRVDIVGRVKNGNHAASTTIRGVATWLKWRTTARPVRVISARWPKAKPQPATVSRPKTSSTN